MSKILVKTIYFLKYITITTNIYYITKKLTSTQNRIFFNNFVVKLQI